MNLATDNGVSLGLHQSVAPRTNMYNNSAMEQEEKKAFLGHFVNLPLPLGGCLSRDEYLAARAALEVALVY